MQTAGSHGQAQYSHPHPGRGRRRLDVPVMVPLRQPSRRGSSAGENPNVCADPSAWLTARCPGLRDTPVGHQDQLRLEQSMETEPLPVWHGFCGRDKLCGVHPPPGTGGAPPCGILRQRQPGLPAGTEGPTRPISQFRLDHPQQQARRFAVKHRAAPRIPKRTPCRSTGAPSSVGNSRWTATQALSS